MTYDVVARTRRKGRPVELYLYRYGPADADIIAYNLSARPITVDDITYEPMPTKRDAITSSGSLDRSTMAVTIPMGTAVAELFRTFPPSATVTLVIKQGHIGDPDSEFLVVWSGRVLSAHWKLSEVELACESLITSLTRPGLRRNYMIGCPLPLYVQGDYQCNANKAAATTTAAVSAIVGRTLTVVGTFVTPQYQQGMVEWTRADGIRERRSIIKTTGSNQVTVAGTLPGLLVGDDVDVILGCPHTLAGCRDIHNNIVNYGGQDRIPIKNPFGAYNNFY